MIIDEETGLLCSPGDVDALTDKSHRLYEAPSLREALGRSAWQWVVGNRSWEVLGPRFFDVYERLYPYHSTRNVLDEKESTIT